MINTGRFPGLEWINEEKTIFRVPWKHDYRKRDATIFREWAIRARKYREDGDPIAWKVNFRCALNGAKGIMEMKDLQEEDCRVYRVLPSQNPKGRPIEQHLAVLSGMPDGETVTH